MAEKNEYFTQKLENGTLQISEDVVHRCKPLFRILGFLNVTGNGT